MLSGFIASFELFYLSYLAVWLIGILLSLLGVFVVARGQVFIVLALSQATALGIAAGLWLGASPIFAMHEPGEFLPATLGTIVAVCAGLTLCAYRRKAGLQGNEVLTAIIYLFASSGALVVLSSSPFGLEELERLLASTVIGANKWDIVLLGALLVSVLLVLWQYFPLVLLLTLDPSLAEMHGLPLRRANLLSGIMFGLAIAMSVRIGGMILAFASLVLPVVAAQTFVRETRQLFWAAPTIFFLTSLPALVLAYGIDSPPAQVVALCLASVTIIGRSMGYFIRR